MRRCLVPGVSKDLEQTVFARNFGGRAKCRHSSIHQQHVRGVHARIGVRLLEDCYAEEQHEQDALLSKGDDKSVAAAEKLQGLSGWEKYRRYLADWVAGRTSSSFPVKLLPAKVREAMEGNKADGSAAKDPWAAKEAEPTPSPAEPAKPRGK